MPTWSLDWSHNKRRLYFILFYALIKYIGSKPCIPGIMCGLEGKISRQSEELMETINPNPLIECMNKKTTLIKCDVHSIQFKMQQNNHPNRVCFINSFLQTVMLFESQFQHNLPVIQSWSSFFRKMNKDLTHLLKRERNWNTCWNC